MQSTAFCRFDDPLLSGSSFGWNDLPKPLRSGQTMVKSSASRSATAPQVMCVRGCPCSKRSGGPEPPWRTLKAPGPTSIISNLKSENINHLRNWKAGRWLDGCTLRAREAVFTRGFPRHRCTPALPQFDEGRLRVGIEMLPRQSTDSVSRRFPTREDRVLAAGQQFCGIVSNLVTNSVETDSDRSRDRIFWVRAR